MKSVSATLLVISITSLPVMAAIDAPAEKNMDQVILSNGNDDTSPAVPGTEQKPMAGDSRGRMLYENHCTSCHESTVHIRAKRKARNFKEVGDWVNQRADWLNLGWTNAEKLDVLQYVNEKYYRYNTNDK